MTTKIGEKEAGLRAMREHRFQKASPGAMRETISKIEKAPPKPAKPKKAKPSPKARAAAKAERKERARADRPKPDRSI